jgi:hypothetical protein
MPNFHGIEYQESSGQAPGVSPKISFNPRRESRLTAQYRVGWDDLATRAFGTAFLGYATVQEDWRGNPTPGYIARSAPNGFNPFVHPDWPGFYYAESFDAEGDVPDDPAISLNATAAFEEAVVRMNFVSPANGWRCLEDSEVVDNRPGFGMPAEYLCLRNMEIVEKVSPYRQTIPPGTGLRWPDGTQVSAAAFVVLYETEIELRWYPVPIDAYDEDAMLALVGKTNKRDFPPEAPGLTDSFLETKPAGTLIMGAPSKEVIRMGDTGFAYIISLKLRHHPFGANYLWRHNPPAGSPGYQLVRRGDGSPLYPAVDYEGGFLPP